MIKETDVMTVPQSVDPAGFRREQLESASPDLLRETVKTFADALMSAEADAVCGAPYGVRSDERTNSRNGHRAREWDTRAGTVELAIPKLRSGSYFPDWLLQSCRTLRQAAEEPGSFTCARTACLSAGSAAPQGNPDVRLRAPSKVADCRPCHSPLRA
jgi:Transposase, Mutator family